MKKIDGRTMFAPTDLRGKRHNNNVNRLHKRQSKKQRYRYRKGQTKAFASPRRTARETSDSAGRVEQVFPRIVLSEMGKDYRANDVRYYKSLCHLR